MEKFVLSVPKWQGELVFSKETLIFVGVILLMIVGILFCFWGYKYFGTILFLGIGTVICYGSYLLVEPMTANSAVRMFLTVSLTFLGICFVYFLSIIWGFFLDKLRIRTALGKRIYLLAALAGAAVIGLTIYYMIWRDEIVAGGIAAVCLVIGVIFQHSKRKKQVRFRSYDDLLKLSRPQFDVGGLRAIPAEAANMGVSAVLLPEYSAPEMNEPEAGYKELEANEPKSEYSELEYEESAANEPKPEYTEAEAYESESEYEELETYESDSEYAAPEMYGEEAEYGEAEEYVPEPGYEELETYESDSEYTALGTYGLEAEYTAPEAYESESKYAESTAAEPEPEVVRMAGYRPERMTDAVKPGTEGYLAYRHEQIKSGKSKRRKRAKGAAFAGGAAFMAAGLGLFIANKVSKGLQFPHSEK